MNLLDWVAAACVALLSVVWLFYPVSIALVARIRRSQPGDVRSDAPTVSVMIATRESPAVTLGRIDDCLRNGYESSKMQVVVAVDSATPLNEFQAVLTHSNITIVRSDAPGGKAAALNAAARAATGSVLVFTDVFQRFRHGAIAQLVSALSGPKVGIVSGKLELPGKSGVLSVARIYWMFERWLRNNEARAHSAVGVTGAIYAMPASLWRPLRAGLINDDVYTPMRLVLEGHRVAFEDAAVAIETRVHSVESEYKRKVRTLTGVVQICAWLPAALLPWRNPIWTQFVIHKLLRLLTPYALMGCAAWAVWRVQVFMSFYSTTLVVCASLWLLASGSRLGVLARGIVREFVLLQSAVVMATVNGVNRRWDVWRP